MSDTAPTGKELREAIARVRGQVADRHTAVKKARRALDRAQDALTSEGECLQNLMELQAQMDGAS